MAQTLNQDAISTDSGISSISGEEEPDPILPPKVSTNKEDIVRRLCIYVERVAKQKKIFCTGGRFHGARRALKRRGWIELNCRRGGGGGGGTGGCMKATFNSSSLNQLDAFEQNLKILKDNVETTLKMLSNNGNNNMRNKKQSVDEFKEYVMYRLLKNFIPNYQWCLSRRRIQWKSLRKDQRVNKFPHSFFTTKIGLHRCLQNLHWFSSYPVASFFPRCYEVSSAEEKKAFIEDYRLTACFSLVRWFCENYSKRGAIGVEERNGKARRSSIEFALQNCREYIDRRNHQDLDHSESSIWEHQWNQFLTDYYLLCHEQDKLQETFQNVGPTSNDLFRQCEEMMKKLKEYLPQFEMDGSLNMWIIKPGSSSRGRGISLAKRLEQILETTNSNSGCNKMRYIVQKYIERPLLIYRTKFDIRQWLLVTSWNPLQIWMYKQSYLRFCSQPYNLQSHHESIHLCNNAIQVKYAVNADRSIQLPAENMWDNFTFHSFLKAQGHGEKWGSVIYPAMRKALIGALLATQDTMSTKNNCFELYGADFMLTEDFNPWLIEINSSPALGSTTAVTSRLCSEVLEDVVRVTVDRKRNKNCDTGHFELIYKQNTLQTPFFVGIDLAVKGVKIDLGSLPMGRKKHAATELAKINDTDNAIRISPSKEDLRDLLSEAHKSAMEPRPVITDLIDNIMSIPSCLQDTQSKISLVREWMEQHRSVKRIEEEMEKEKDEKKEEHEEVKEDKIISTFKGKDDKWAISPLSIDMKEDLCSPVIRAPLLKSANRKSNRKRRKKERKAIVVVVSANKKKRVRSYSSEKIPFTTKKKPLSDPSKVLLQKIPICESHRLLQKYGCSHFLFPSY